MDPVVGVDGRTSLSATLLDGHGERVDDEIGNLDGVNRRAHNSSAAGIERTASDNLAFSRRMYRDVKDPEFIQG